jgi:hypothetical protein
VISILDLTFKIGEAMSIKFLIIYPLLPGEREGVRGNYD